MPTATHFCRSCQTEKSVDLFFKRQGGKPRTPCKACIGKRVGVYEAANKEAQRNRRAAWRLRHLPSAREKNRVRMARAVAAVREFVAKLKVERGCADCGYNAHPDALDLDHVRGGKVRSISLMVGTGSLAAVVAEIEKCDVRCVVCHRLRTERLRPRIGNPSATTLRKREMVRKAKERPCEDCGKQFPQYAMDFDHIDPTTKVGGVTNVYRFSEAALAAEILKCRVLCGCCHRVRTNAQRSTADASR